jgi:hypothetical protein
MRRSPCRLRGRRRPRQGSSRATDRLRGQPPRAQGGRHGGEAALVVRPLPRGSGPRRQPRRPRAAAPERLHHLRRAAHAARARHLRALPPGSAHPPRALVRPRPGQRGGQLHRRQHGVDLRQRRRGDQGGLRRALRGGPDRPDLRPVRLRRPAAGDDLHAAQQDVAAAERLHRARRQVGARHAGAARRARRPQVPRHHRRAVRPHLRRAPQAEGGRRLHHDARPRGRRDRVDGDARRHDARHRRPPAPRRAVRDRREHGLQGEPVPERRPRDRRHPAAEVRGAVEKRRALLRGLPDTRP